MKIGTLLPSATEIVCALGLEKKLVGISHECDFPSSVSNLPCLTSSSIGKYKNSEDIHQSVEVLLKNSLSVYDLDLELLKSLKPNYLITQDLCDVCAVSFNQQHILSSATCKSMPSFRSLQSILIVLRIFD